MTKIFNGTNEMIPPVVDNKVDPFLLALSENRNLNFFSAIVNLNRIIKNQTILWLPAIAYLTISFNGNKCVLIKFEEKYIQI